MDRIRAFTQHDIPQVARLYQRTFGGGVAFPLEPLESYFHEVFFENPWGDRDLSSLVYERDARTIVGFLGVIPRWFTLKGRLLKAAVSTQLMVDNSSRNRLAALKLLQAFFAGPQELSLTDGANETSRKIWKALGGVEIPVYSLCWTRRLRAADCAASIEEARMQKQGFRQAEADADYMEQDLDISTVLENLPRLASTVSLCPQYDHRFLTWLLSVAAARRRHGELRKRVVRDAEGIKGWYVYYLNVGGASQVLQLVTSARSFSAVLNQLFESLRRQGATEVTGRLDPQYLHEFSSQHCQFSAGSAVLVRASDPVLLEAIYKGDALLSRLDGEWWNGFSEFVTRPHTSPHTVRTAH